MRIILTTLVFVFLLLIVPAIGEAQLECGSCGSGGCSSNEVYCCNPWPVELCFCVGDPSCGAPACAGTDTSCGTFEPCMNCNSYDGCSGDYYYDWFCVGGDTCSSDNGQCTPACCSGECVGGICQSLPPCTNDCSPLGSTQCSGSSSYQTCGDYDADSCLEWSSAISCPSGQECSGGSCGLCENECPSGWARRCASETSFQECGDFDSDGCLEWGPEQACPINSECDLGACVSTGEGALCCNLSAGGACVTRAGCTGDYSCCQGNEVINCMYGCWSGFCWGPAAFFFENCDEKDGLKNKGDPYTACNTAQTHICTYQDREYYDYSCSGGECVLSSITPAEPIESNCVECASGWQNVGVPHPCCSDASTRATCQDQVEKTGTCDPVTVSCLDTGNTRTITSNESSCPACQSCSSLDISCYDTCASNDLSCGCNICSNCNDYDGCSVSFPGYYNDVSCVGYFCEIVSSVCNTALCGAECEPAGSTKACGSGECASTQTCVDCAWEPCSDSDGNSCGNCGTCSNGFCVNEGVCFPGSEQCCENNEIQYCESSCSWGPCQLVEGKCGYTGNQPPDNPGTPPSGPGSGGSGEQYPEGEEWSHCSFKGVSLPTFYWTYSDPDGDPQQAYEIRIDDNAGFSRNPDPTEFYCGGQVCSGGSSTAFTPLPTDWSDWSDFNTNYWWIVRVQDDQGNWSEWSDPNKFRTPNHAYPWPDFTWQPEEPTQQETVEFNPDDSETFGGTTISSHLWTVTEGNGTFVDETASESQYPHVQFSTKDNKMKLKITDSDGYACTCQAKEITATLPLPEYKEASPIIWLKEFISSLVNIFNNFL